MVDGTAVCSPFPQRVGVLWARGRGSGRFLGKRAGSWAPVSHRVAKMQEPRLTTHGEGPESDADRALQEGLSRLSVPATSPAFDERVLASLALTEPAAERGAFGWVSAFRETIRAWWNGPSFQMIFSGAACAAILTLGAYAFSVNAPVSGSTAAPTGTGVATAALSEFLDAEGSSSGVVSYRGMLLGVPRVIPPLETPREQPDRRRGSGSKSDQTPGAAATPGRDRANGREG